MVRCDACNVPVVRRVTVVQEGGRRVRVCPDCFGRALPDLESGPFPGVAAAAELFALRTEADLEPGKLIV